MKEKIFELSYNDFDIMNDVLDEIEEFRSYEGNTNEQRSLKKMQDIFGYDLLEDVQKGKKKVKIVIENIELED